MLSFARRLESISRSVESAVASGDIVKRYKQVFVLLHMLLEKHKELSELAISIERRSGELNTLPTKYHSDKYCTHHSRTGWGRSSRSNSWTEGRSGNQLQPIGTIDVNDYHERLTAIVVDQFRFNEELVILQQYANQWKVYRDGLLQVKPRNICQRELQNVLLVSQRGISWDRKSIDENPVLGVMNGKFAALINVPALFKKDYANMNDKKGKIGRQSYSQGYQIVESSYYHLRYRMDSLTVRQQNWERYSKSHQTKNSRCCRVEHYVKQSVYYQKRIGWIKGIFYVADKLKVLPYADEWKERYQATNRLCYSVATSVPYVSTICTSQPVQIGTLEYLETAVPIYHCKGIPWEQNKTEQNCYYLGKTGSTIVDRELAKIDWLHSAVSTEPNEVLRVFRTRTDSRYAEKQSLKERRKEIAGYARKLIWVETINMLDSKAAGNCLPGTLQFARGLGVPCPDNWTDYTISARQLLRAWKAKGYGVNRLVLPAIDAAVNRVKATLCQLTVSGYVPSGVK